MLLSFIILVLIGLVMVLDGDHDKWTRAVGAFMLIVAVAICLPIIIQNTIRSIKEQGIIEYMNQEVEVINHDDSTYTFLWIDCD